MKKLAASLLAVVLTLNAVYLYRRSFPDTDYFFDGEMFDGGATG